MDCQPAGRGWAKRTQGTPTSDICHMQIGVSHWAPGPSIVRWTKVLALWLEMRHGILIWRPCLCSWNHCVKNSVEHHFGVHQHALNPFPTEWDWNLLKIKSMPRFIHLSVQQRWCHPHFINGKTLLKGVIRLVTSLQKDAQDFQRSCVTTVFLPTLVADAMLCKCNQLESHRPRESSSHQNTIEQWLCNTVPRVVVTPAIQLFSLLLRNCDFAATMNHN